MPINGHAPPNQRMKLPGRGGHTCRTKVSPVCGRPGPQLKRNPLGSGTKGVGMKPALFFVIGASGAGKTAATLALQTRTLPGVLCYFFDTVGVPTAEVMQRDFGGGEQWQAVTTARWIERLAADPENGPLAVLEGQTRPSFIRPALERTGIRHARIVLLDAQPQVRALRLQGHRADLASFRMDAWAVYLRGQADALGLPIVDTTHLSIEQVADALERELEVLRAEAAV